MSSPESQSALNPVVSVVMGSASDWETLQGATNILSTLGIPFEAKIVSAHRTPRLLVSFAEEAANRGIKVIIAGAGGAAHLPGMVASMTHLPVIGVPVESKALNGIDSLLSIVQMPAGIPVATVAIGKAGATNSALLAASILATNDTRIAAALKDYRAKQTEEVLKTTLPPATLKQ
jgi:5-(carboxyamino)imidazole ribonucleotide mutase